MTPANQLSAYQLFLANKTRLRTNNEISITTEINKSLFAFQSLIVRWALRKGKAAIFAECGLGKTLMQLEWAHHVNRYTNKRVLIVTPLAVSEQTIREGGKFGIAVSHINHGGNLEVVNYESLHKVDTSVYGGVVLDESSILKNYAGKTRNQIIDAFAKTPYKLACSATPAPNDFMELGNHAEFLDICSRLEMLAEYFVHDGGETQKWRLKGHAQKPFWKWLASWACVVTNPNELGFQDERYTLPALNIENVQISANYHEPGFLFPMAASTLEERRNARRNTIEDRAAKAAELIKSKPNEPWLIWCNLNNEADALTAAIPEAVEIRGTDHPAIKAERMMDFTDGKIKYLVTKPSIAGFGMNWQHCSNIIFLGLSDSYEEFYQAVRRCWRFGQYNTVNAYIITADTEGAVIQNIKRKESQAKDLTSELVINYVKQELYGL